VAYWRRKSHDFIWQEGLETSSCIGANLVNMSTIDFLHGLLSHPVAYVWLQRVLGAEKLRRVCLDRFAQIRSGERVLDIGCGPGWICDLMPDVDYVGFDTDKRYIDYAKTRYAARGKFYCELFTERHASSLPQFDLVLLFGLLHHIDDPTALETMRLVSLSLKQGGRVVTLDPCFTPGQSAMARRMALSDRGRFVRNPEQYDALVTPHLNIELAEVLDDAGRIPSTARIMRLRRRDVSNAS
jgi:SAM-dependent methyltransferase